MRVQAPPRAAWEKYARLPVRARLDELDQLGDRHTPAEPLYVGSLALALQPDADEEPLSEQAELSWPPILDSSPRTRGRPTRKDTLWRAVAQLSAPMAGAVLTVANDLFHSRLRVRLLTRGPGYVVERSALYYSRCGDLTHTQARRALDLLVHQLRASPVSVDELEHSGICPRRLRGKQRHGQHWFLRAGAYDDLAHVIGLLHAHGIRPPPSSRPLSALSDEIHVLDVRSRIRRSWVVCPLHEDHDPSMILNENGTAWCFGGCGLAGRWERADQDPWDLDANQSSAPLQIRFRAFVRALPTGATRPPVPADHAQALPPQPAKAPPSSSCVRVVTGLQSGFRDLGLQGYSPAGAREAGAPGVHPVQKYLGHYAGRREWAQLGPTTQTYVREADEPAHAARLHREIRPMGLVMVKVTSRYGSQSYATSLDLLDVLRTADQRSNGKKTSERARVTYEARLKDLNHRYTGRLRCDDLPDLYVGLDHQSHTALRAFPKERTTMSGRVITVAGPVNLVPTATCWVGVDIDHIEIPHSQPTDADPDVAQNGLALVDQQGGKGCVGDQIGAQVGRQLEATLSQHALFTGRVGVVRTGPRGWQVVAELRHARWDPRELWQSEDFRAMVGNLSRLTLSLFRAEGCTGGKIDTAVQRAGAHVRKPSWRIAKDGSLFRSRLVFASE